MKNNLMLLSALSLLVVAPLTTMAAGGTFGAGGDGSSESEAILVEDCLDLDALDNKTEYYKFANDITDCASVDFQGADNFKGTIDGAGYSILGYTGSSHIGSDLTVFFDFAGDMKNLGFRFAADGASTVPSLVTASGSATVTLDNIAYVADLLVSDGDFLTVNGMVTNLSGTVSDSYVHINYIGSGEIWPLTSNYIGVQGGVGSSSTLSGVVASLNLSSGVTYNPFFTTGHKYYNDIVSSAPVTINNTVFVDCGVDCASEVTGPLNGLSITPANAAAGVGAVFNNWPATKVFSSLGGRVGFSWQVTAASSLATILDAEPTLVDDGLFASYISRFTSATNGDLGTDVDDHRAMNMLRESAKAANFANIFVDYAPIFQMVLEELVGPTAYSATNPALSGFLEVVREWRYANQ